MPDKLRAVDSLIRLFGWDRPKAVAGAENGEVSAIMQEIIESARRASLEGWEAEEGRPEP